ncbi:uncharacterized protein Tco025E_01502 [Trypanosoma conorhini]|uniref:RING-type domain-containing protein n=1 Tax=Trypanosoma conorhini TaxID=83891 RepID=A0A3R7LDI9_9TRYP|nr:uncharacterized protein Tco025E_01502 [Trypanosoma conorhini]RNF26228.1 hypothetical protein Tco025E_01502 [Trypanosoma conorhini]
MAGLTSDNISIASARQYGFSKERDTCVFCGKRSRPPPTDPLAPVFVFFSLVDCRHYVCQPCALVNCDNAGRFIRCPTCHSVSRLAQTGKKRTGHDESRVSIDDGVSSVASHASRRSVRLLADGKPARSALARADRSKKRSSSVQFMANPTASVVSPPANNARHSRGDQPATSPLTLDAVGNLPRDPSYAQRERLKEAAVQAKPKEAVAVNLYTIKSSAAPRRRSSGTRASSVPLPQTEHRYLAPPLPFAPPPPLRIRTVEEEEEGAEDEAKEAAEQQDVNVPLSSIADEIRESLLATLAKESQERSTIAVAEEYRRNAMSKQREIREREMLAARGSLSNEFDVRLSPRTPLDASDGQVSATSDDETPAGPLGKHPRVALQYDKEEPLKLSVPVSELSVHPPSMLTDGMGVQKLEATEVVAPRVNTEAEAKLAELQERARREMQHQLERLHAEVMPPTQVAAALDAIEMREREIIEGVETVERRLLHTARSQDEVERSALSVQRRSADRTAQVATEYLAYISKEFDEFAASEMEHRAFIEELQRSGWSSLVRDFHASLKGLLEVELLRLSEQRQVELTRASLTLATEETTARMRQEQAALNALTRLHMTALETIADCRRQLQLKEMQRGASRIVAEQQLYMQQFYGLAAAEDATRWKVLEEEQRDRHAEWTAFVTTMPTLRTATAVPSAGASRTALQASSSSHAPESSHSATTPPTSVASHYLAALFEEAELEALRLQQTERHERHGLINVFLTQSQRLRAYEAPMETTYMDTPLSQRAIANGRRRLELREEEKRIELQQRSWASFRSIANKATEEQEQIARMERMLRAIAERSRSVLHRCFAEAELALMDEERHERQSVEVEERRTRVNHARDAVRREEVLLAEERLSHDAFGTQFLEAMDVAVRQFSSEAARIAQEEHLERLALAQVERLECLSLTQTLESRIRLDECDAQLHLADLHSTLETTTAASAWRARLSLVETEELRVRDGMYNDEAGEWLWWVTDERRQRIELASLETERLRQAREKERLLAKLRECEGSEGQRRVGVEREEARARAALVGDEARDAANACKKGEQRVIEEARRERHASQSQRRRRALEDLLQDEDDERHYICEDERDARRRLRHQALQHSCDILDKKRTSPAKSEEPSKSGTTLASQNAGRSPVSDPSAAVFDEEWIRQKRLRELAREEELIEAQMRLREAEIRIAEEAERRARSEEEKRVALAESERLLREAEGRAEERIRRAREEAQRYAEQEMNRVRDASERQAAHAAALRAIEEEEKTAMVEAQLRAAERALKEAEGRAAEDVRRVKAEAEAFAAAEAQRVALESRRLLQEHREKQEEQLRQKDFEVQQRLRGIELQAQEAILAAKAESTRAAEEAQRRLEELEARYQGRAAAVDAAKASVRVAQQRMRELEESRQSTPQHPSMAGCVETTTRNGEAVAAAAVQGYQGQPKDGYALTAVVCTNVIRAAIREAVEEVVKATKEAWHVTEEAEQRLRMERRRLRRREAERDRAEQELLDAENKGIRWGEEEEEETAKNWVGAGAEEEMFNTPLEQSTTRHFQGKRIDKRPIYPQPPPDGGCAVCHRKDTVSPCVECGSQVCRYCGPAAPHRACCEQQYIDVVNVHRRRLSGERQEAGHAKQDAEEIKGEESSLWEVEDIVDALPERTDVATSPLGVRRQLLPDEESEARTDDYDEPRDEEDATNETRRSASTEAVDEPRTERKRYEAFFVPLTSDAEPRRPKPPTPRNYVPGVFTAASRFAKAERRCSPPVGRARSNRHVDPAAEKEARQRQPRFPGSAPKERPAFHANQKNHRQPCPRQPLTALQREVKEPLLGLLDPRLRRREAERVVMQDPLSGFGRSSSPGHLGGNFPAKPARPSQCTAGRISPIKPSIELYADFNEFAHRDPTGLERTYYAGRPVRPLEQEHDPEDLADTSHRYGARRQHQEQYRPRKLPSREDERHVNVSRERVFLTTYHELPDYAGTRRRQESVRYDAQRREECNVHTTPTLHQLDQRLRHLQQHRVLSRSYERSPDSHCLRHHFHQESAMNCRPAAASSTARRPTPCPHDPCITVHLFPTTYAPTAARTTASRQRTRGGSSRRNTSRAGRRSTPRVVSPPWRTDFNSEFVRPPWNFEQPHSFVARSYKRTLLPFEI